MTLQTGRTPLLIAGDVKAMSAGYHGANAQLGTDQWLQTNGTRVVAGLSWHFSMYRYRLDNSGGTSWS